MQPANGRGRELLTVGVASHSRWASVNFWRALARLAASFRAFSAVVASITSRYLM
jgi:hypothetical protein